VAFSELWRGLWILPDVWVCGELWGLLERARGLRVEKWGGRCRAWIEDGFFVIGKAWKKRTEAARKFNKEQQKSQRRRAIWGTKFF
jgi:hypothetical protein